VRYPKGGGPSEYVDEPARPLAIGSGETLRSGDDAVIIAIGSAVYPALEAAEILSEQGVSVEVINARFARPLDENRILEALVRCKRAVVAEENSVVGGFGSAVLELAADAGLTGVLIRRLGLPDSFVEQGSLEKLRKSCGLSADGLASVVIGLVRPPEPVRSRRGWGSKVGD